MLMNSSRPGGKRGYLASWTTGKHVLRRLLYLRDRRIGLGTLVVHQRFSRIVLRAQADQRYNEETETHVHRERSRKLRGRADI